MKDRDQQADPQIPMKLTRNPFHEGDQKQANTQTVKCLSPNDLSQKKNLNKQTCFELGEGKNTTYPHWLNAVNTMIGI